ncbi:hypothetical protein GQ53DRAFT_756534 [Thozetella sp. PMI_491]|nr:hypothetical protein GQ53DRAFT_756534 [Thozetella sp. PMI_491]
MVLPQPSRAFVPPRCWISLLAPVSSCSLVNLTAGPAISGCTSRARSLGHPSGPCRQPVFVNLGRLALPATPALCGLERLVSVGNGASIVPRGTYTYVSRPHSLDSQPRGGVGPRGDRGHM